MAEQEITGVLDALLRGSRLDQSVQQMIVIAKAMDNPETPARDLAALSNRALVLTREIDELRRLEDEEAEDSVVSEDEEFDADEI